MLGPQAHSSKLFFYRVIFKFYYCRIFDKNTKYEDEWKQYENKKHYNIFNMFT